MNKLDWFMLGLVIGLAINTVALLWRLKMRKPRV